MTDYNTREYLASLSNQKMRIIKAALACAYKFSDFRYASKEERDDAIDLLKELSQSDTGMPSKHELKNSITHFPTDTNKTYLVKIDSYTTPNKEDYFLCKLHESGRFLLGRGVDSRVVSYDTLDLRDMFTQKTKFKWIELP